MTAEWVLALAAVAIGVCAYQALGLLKAIRAELDLLRAEVRESLHPVDSIGTPDSYAGRILDEIHGLSYRTDLIGQGIEKLTADYDAAEDQRSMTPP